MSKIRDKIIQDMKSGKTEHLNEHFCEALVREDDLLFELLKSGANVNAPNKSGVLPIFLACREKPKMIDFLIHNGAKLNVHETGDGDGTTPLMIVSMYHPNKIRIMLEYGADPLLEDFNGQTALSWALETDEPESVEILLPHYPNIEIDYLKSWEEAYHDKKLGMVLQREIDKRVFLEKTTSKKDKAEPSKIK